MHRSLARAVPIALVTGLAPILAGAQTTPDSGVALPTVVVTATRAPVRQDAAPAAVTVITRRDLEEQGITRLSDALRESAGVSLAQSGSVGNVTSLFLRGGNSNYVKVLVDGVPLNAPGGQLDLANLTTDDIERIEIVRGPASVLYGSDAVTGVVQIFTRRGTGRPSLDVAARGGTYGTREAEATASGRAGIADLSVGGARRATDGALPFNNQYRNSTYTAGAGVAGGSGDARLTLRYGDADYHYPTNGNGAVVDRNQYRTERRLVAGLDAGRRLTSALAARLLVTSSWTRGVNDNQPDGPADTAGFYGRTNGDVYRRGADARIEALVAGAQRVTVGGAYEREHETSGGVTRFGSFPESESSFAADRRILGGYAQLAGEPSRAISYQVSGRLDHNSEYGDVGTYRAAANVAVAPGLRVRAALGTAFKEPLFSEVFDASFSVGNRDLRPERSTSREVGATQVLLGGSASVGVTYFDQVFRDLVQYQYFDDPSLANYYNVARATSRGVELEARASVAPSLSLRAAYTYLRTQVTDSGFGGFGATEEGRPLLRRPAHTLDVGGAWRPARAASITADVSRVGARDDRDYGESPSARVRLPGYTRLDLAGEVGLLRASADPARLSLTARVENATAAAYEPVFGFVAPGRTVLVGFRAGL